ncbi:hypothetical protein FOA52_007512 [Chlamydomonas sp. UWO 241]|nr:hypothetical protein FOA52_007512 [Chlamydomonas sp. UWO 241]
MHALARCASSSPAPTASAHALVFDAPGEPQSVLSLRELPVVPPGEGEISVRFLLSPINPSDINTVEGKYPLRPELPGVPGHEGVGEVTALGPKVDGLSIGDRVVPLEACVGTWRSVGTFPVASFHRVQSDISLEAAATLCINPPSALAMLERFVTMSPGDVVVQIEQATSL